MTNDPSNKAPRMWWIDTKVSTGLADLARRAPDPHDNFNQVPVIEHSAYEKLMAENEALRWPSSDASKQYFRRAFKSIDELQDFYCGYANKLKAENAELREALKSLLMDTEHVDHDCGDEGCPVYLARQALNKAGGGE